MYFSDLSNYKYSIIEISENDSLSLENVFNIGWLSNEFEYPKGNIEQSLLKSLIKIIKNNQINQTRGYMKCCFCGDKISIPIHNLTDEEITLGSAEIWIPYGSSKFFSAPNLIYHYIEAHKYLPPLQFINSIKKYDFLKKYDFQKIHDESVDKTLQNIKIKLKFIIITDKDKRELNFIEGNKNIYTEYKVSLFENGLIFDNERKIPFSSIEEFIKSTFSNQDLVIEIIEEFI